MGPVFWYHSDFIIKGVNYVKHILLRPKPTTENVDRVWSGYDRTMRSKRTVPQRR